MIDELLASINTIAIQTQNNLSILGYILLILWSTFFINRFIFPNLLLLGIIPRRAAGIPGILISPLLHADFNHLFFNSIPLVVLSDFILIQGLTFYLYVTLIITFLSGLVLWCFGKPGLHIGASGVITGYWSFLLMNSYQTMTPTTIILGIISLYYFAGIFLGIFPRGKGVSWEGHLFGLLAGVATSYIMGTFPLQP